MYYMINQNPAGFIAKNGLEYDEDISSLFAALNNSKIRRDVFRDAGYFEKIANDEHQVKECLRTRAYVKSIYINGEFIKLMYDEGVVHIFGYKPFLKEEDILDRQFKLGLIQSKYKDVISYLLNECNEERTLFYDVYQKMSKVSQQVYLAEENGMTKEEVIKSLSQDELDAYNQRGKILKSHMHNAKNISLNLYEDIPGFPKLSSVIKKDEFNHLAKELSDNRLSFYDVAYSKSQIRLMKYLNLLTNINTY